MRKVCLITGAGGRLGQALCSAWRDRYYIIAAYRNRIPVIDSQLQSYIEFPANESISGPSGKIYCVQGDLSKREDIRRLVEIGMARFGQIDFLINAAADLRFHGKLLETWQFDEYCMPQLNQNAVAPILLTSAVFSACWKADPVMNKESNRCVVNISSMSAVKPSGVTGHGFYAASKASLNVLTSHLAIELKDFGVRANAICPGRFTDEVGTMKVVAAIDDLVEGDLNHLVLTDFM